MAGGQERVLRRRIKSVESTKKITKAMELIAASRIVKAQARVAAAEMRVRRRLAALPQTPATFGMIHADLHLGNCLFRNRVAIPIDFDDCGFGWFAYDLAVVLASVERWPHYEALRQGLLDGYGPVDLDAVDALIDARRVALVRWMAGLLTDATFGERLRPGINALVGKI